MIGKHFIRLGRFFGIETGLTFTWIVMFLFITMGASRIAADQLPGLGPGITTTLGAVIAIGLYLSILFHEFGHALTARAFGINTSRITLHLFGGVAMLDGEPRRPRDEFWITAAGPAVSFVLGAVLGLGWLLAAELQAPAALTFLLQNLALLNIVIALFNCLPAFPMDGGRVFRAAIWAISGNYLRSTRIASWGGFLLGGLMVLWGMTDLLRGDFSGGLLHTLFGMFLFGLSRASVKQAEIVAAFHGLKVSDLMRPLRAVVPSEALVSEVVEDYFMPMKIDQLPVIEGRRLLGCLSSADVQERSRRQWDWIRASELTKPYDSDNIISPDEDAVAALHRFGQNGRHSVAVFDGRKLKGHILDRDFARRLTDFRRREGLT